MKNLILCVTLIFIFLPFLPASATPIDDKIAVLRKAMLEEMAADQAKADATHAGNPFPGKMYEAQLGPLSDQLDNNPGPDEERSIEMEVTSIYSAYSTEAVQKAGADLVAELHKESKDRAKAAAEEIESGIQALLKRVSEEIGKAKKPEDLDDSLVDLQKFQSQRNGQYGSDNQQLYQQVSSVFEFTKVWQDYLTHQVGGQTELEKQDLQNLSQNNFAVGIMPRSQILERLAALNTTPPVSANGTSVSPPLDPKVQQIQQILKNVKTLDDMEPALDQLAALRMNNLSAQDAYNQLASLVRIYSGIKAGLPTNMDLNINGYNNSDVHLSSDLRLQLLILALQHYFESYKGTPPAPNETPQAFVDRVIADADSREDWALLQQALTAQTYLNRNSLFGNSVAYANTSGGIEYLLAGLNQETAGQYALAVVSYQTALKISNTATPAKLIGDKLAAIERDHPKEYAAGMQMVLTPPTPRFLPGMPYFPGAPGMNTNLAPVAAPPTPSPTTAPTFH